RSWGDSVLELSPDAGRLLKSWTPTNQQALASGDVDLGSTAPALLGSGLVVQGGKDSKLRLIDFHAQGLGKTGGELKTVAPPEALFSAPAVWRHAGQTWLFVSTFSSATQAFRLEGRRLKLIWSNGTGGTSPVVAGGLLFVYDPIGGVN